jgi:protein O-mannosyl-transferase
MIVSYDDNQYITDNNYVQSGINKENVKWAFTNVVSSNWHPLTLMSHMIDWKLFGANASGHHLVSLLLHIGAVLFLFLFLNKATNNIWPAAFVAALFALHPLRVESVAWASERKDVLSMFLGLACLYAYAFYAEKTKISRYILCLILFALALMSKPMLVTLPFVLLLLDYWPLGRWQKAVAPVKEPIAATERAEKKKTKKSKADSIKEKKISVPVKSRSHLIGMLLWEKAPFIFLTVISNIVTVWAQNKGGSVTSLEYLPFYTRFANAIISYVSYLGKTFWPIDLAIFYPYEYSIPLWKVLASCLILIGISIIIIYYTKKLPFLFVGWFWYLGTLVPVIGLVQVGSQSMADRYTYLPSIGIAIMLAWGIPLLFSRKNMRKKILFPTGVAFLAILVGLTWQQCSYWKNSISLFSHALRVTKDNFMAHNSRGYAYVKLGQYQQAIEDFNQAIRLNPNYALAYYNRGTAYANLGRHQQAIEDFNKSIRLNPNDESVYYNRGTAYHKLSQYQQAIEDFNEAIHLKPNYIVAYYNRGTAYANLGRYQQAIEDFNQVIRLNPNDAFACNNRGTAYANLGQYQQAIEDFNQAIRLKLDYADAYEKRGLAYLLLGNKKLSCYDAQKACDLGHCKVLEIAKGKGLCR